MCVCVCVCVCFTFTEVVPRFLVTFCVGSGLGAPLRLLTRGENKHTEGRETIETFNRIKSHSLCMLGAPQGAVCFFLGGVFFFYINV